MGSPAGGGLCVCAKERKIRPPGGEEILFVLFYLFYRGLFYRRFVGVQH